MNSKALLAACLLGAILGSAPVTANAGGYVSINHGFGLSTYRPDPDHHGLNKVHRAGSRYDRNRQYRERDRRVRHKARHFSNRYGKRKHRLHRYTPRYYYGYPYGAGGISIYYGSGGSSIRYSAPLFYERQRW